MLGQARSPSPVLHLPHGGVDTPEILCALRTITSRLRAAGCRASWLVVAKDEVVGLCGYKQPPTEQGRVEIGYGIAKRYRNVGHATRAVAAMVTLARRDAAVSNVVAATAAANLASQTVLERNGFSQTGVAPDGSDDATLIWWRLNLL